MPRSRARIEIRSRTLRRGRLVFIRRLNDADAAELFAKMRDSRLLLRPWITPPATQKELRTRMRRYDWVRNASIAVCVPSGEIAGVINLNEIVRGVFHSAYLGYYGLAGYAGKGLMSEGLSLVISYAFQTMKLHRLEANIQPGNLASKALVRRCGFAKEGFSPKYLKIGGRWRDHERWAILRQP